MAKFFIAAGHGGGDPGASYHGTTERDVITPQVDAAYEILKTQDLKGWEIVQVPNEHALIEEVKWINANDNPATDRCVAIHMNANDGTPGTGIEAFYGNKALAQAMYDAAVAETGLKARRGGTQADPVNDGIDNPNYYYFNRETTSASAIVEMGFINNLDDLAAVRKNGAMAIVKGVLKSIGSAYVAPAPAPVPEPIPTPTPVPTPAPIPVPAPNLPKEEVKDMDKFAELIKFLRANKTKAVAGLLALAAAATAVAKFLEGFTF